uniref:Uncharacterized protein n=1 Tax=Kwoniella dejecticola CBS 10117 TaxID=1296121 RepID=A0A1A6ADR4_9TREE|nr:uncharacterized protein I303_00016 [Kwoniella dejecticola CBS 10117]OBR88205.1 hypothetical protein I303_00016 [Kwoniella dejecticola CBS 10117]
MSRQEHCLALTIKLSYTASINCTELHHLLVSIAFTFTIIASPIVAQNFPKGYDGCYAIPSGGSPTGPDPAEFNLPHNNRDRCIATCTQSEIASTWAFFWYTIDAVNPEIAIPNCRCSQIAPPVGNWRHGDAVGDCYLDGDETEYGSYLTFTDYQFTGCYDAISPNAPPPFNVENIDQCLATCPILLPSNANGSLEYAIVTINVSDQWLCRCSFKSADVPPFPQTVLSVCDYNQFFIYEYTGSITPSQAAKRRRRRSLDIDTRKNRLGADRCPEGLEACPLSEIESQSGGHFSGEYECIDTSNELESCGGCIFGPGIQGVE